MMVKILFIGFLCLPLCCMVPADPEETSKTKDEQSFPLDMAQNSVDDKYSACIATMEAKVKDTYFQKEINNILFRTAWTAAEKCANRNIKDREPGDEALTKNHMQAICVYTAGGPEDFYKSFNEEVKNKGKEYSSSFLFHSLHFWLTRVIQILKSNNNECLTTYRRTKSEYTGDVNKEIRFGTFTSSSKLSTLTHFGKKTCFKITTCYGAYLKKYPTLKEHEQEVLIPPYEKFKIISKGKTPELGDCTIVYVLKSTGFKSNLDCKVAK